MKAIDLSLAHNLYRVDINTIERAEIDSLIMYESRKMIRVTFFNDKKLYFVKVNDTNIYKTYYFSKEEAVEAQKKLRTDALIKADLALQKCNAKLKELKKNYSEEN